MGTIFDKDEAPSLALVQNYYIVLQLEEGEKPSI